MTDDDALKRAWDLTGRRFAMFTVLSRYAGRRWLCRCDCGNDVVLATWRIVGTPMRGPDRSCGCARRELIGRARRVHGLHGTPEYIAWESMIQRCTNSRHNRYQRYGGRGIRVCERWRESFEAFLADMGTKPSPNHSIDRVDNDGNYEPGNCRWATPREQSAHTSQTRWVILHGVRMSVRDAAERLGMNRSTLASRIYRGRATDGVVIPGVSDGQ